MSDVARRKPFQCGRCKRRFKQEAHLSQHRRAKNHGDRTDGTMRADDIPERIPRDILADIASDFPDGAYLAFMNEHGYDY